MLRISPLAIATQAQGWDFPLALPHGRLRRWIKTALGSLFIAMQPALAQRLEAGQAPRNLGERIALAGLVRRHRKTGTLDRLAPQHARFWESAAAVRFHAGTEARFQHTFMVVHRGIVDRLAGLLEDGAFDTLCEIGCGSGLVLDYAAHRLSGLRRLVGIDLSVEQSALNAARATDPRLTFVGADAAQWIPAHAGAGWAFLSYGVLEYIPHKALSELFATMAARSPTLVALIEPIDAAFDFARDGDSRAYGGELSYTHNYPRLLADAGFGLVHREECVHRGMRWLMLIALA